MHQGCYKLASGCDLVGAAERRDFITVWAMLLGDNSSGIVFFAALCIIRGKMCRQVFRTRSLRRWAWACWMKRVFRRSGPGPSGVCYTTGVLDPRNRPFAKRDFCKCIGATWGQPNMCVGSLNKHARRPAGRCYGSQAVWEVESAGK